MNLGHFLEMGVGLMSTGRFVWCLHLVLSSGDGTYPWNTIGCLVGILGCWVWSILSCWLWNVAGLETVYVGFQFGVDAREFNLYLELCVLLWVT